MHTSRIELRIAEVLSDSQLVLNAGENHGIQKGDEFIVYGLSNNEIIDPATQRSLGKLELYRGTGQIIYVQDTMSIIQALPSASFARVSAAISGTTTATFDNATRGDYVKPNATLVSPQQQN